MLVLLAERADTRNYTGERLRTNGYKDTHGIPLLYITAPGGTIDFFQTFKFRDRRTGSVDIPMANSGFIITFTVFMDPTTGTFKLRVTKSGAATTANGITSDAGVTTDGGIAGPITREV